MSGAQRGDAQRLPQPSSHSHARPETFSAEKPPSSRILSAARDWGSGTPRPRAGRESAPPSLAGQM